MVAMHLATSSGRTSVAKTKPLDHFYSSSLFIATIIRPHFGHSSPKYPGGNPANTADLKTCANFPHGQADCSPLLFLLASVCCGHCCSLVVGAGLRLSRFSIVTPADQRAGPVWRPVLISGFPASRFRGCCCGYWLRQILRPALFCSRRFLDASRASACAFAKSLSLAGFPPRARSFCDRPQSAGERAGQ